MNTSSTELDKAIIELLHDLECQYKATHNKADLFKIASSHTAVKKLYEFYKNAQKTLQKFKNNKTK
jgi:Mn-dependent DtxR family transcriptional regulator